MIRAFIFKDIMSLYWDNAGVARSGEKRFCWQEQISIHSSAANRSWDAADGRNGDDTTDRHSCTRRVNVRCLLCSLVAYVAGYHTDCKRRAVSGVHKRYRWYSTPCWLTIMLLHIFWLLRISYLTVTVIKTKNSSELLETLWHFPFDRRAWKAPRLSTRTRGAWIRKKH